LLRWSSQAANASSTMRINWGSVRKTRLWKKLTCMKQPSGIAVGKLISTTELRALRMVRYKGGYTTPKVMPMNPSIWYKVMRIRSLTCARSTLFHTEAAVADARDTLLRTSPPQALRRTPSVTTSSRMPPMTMTGRKAKKVEPSQAWQSAPSPPP